ncbi:nucleic acid/nucleotide deaminase domain-containing protein [Actinokineospora globicatena]|uniref:Uncharacterized protein n=1 Tax=Actinokineospora globicatena TaxID=103729 RepID=A0A9W6QJ47_9PSEU|nr:nucleic acid/nucleotide deaminase domain-containing protein [Actinokineospora globicatena]GLW89549.1 hypothetical protein Aglo03_03650 [Actinokineospora globicatena]
MEQVQRPSHRPPGVVRGGGVIALQRLAGNRAAARAVAGMAPAPVQRYVLRPVSHNDDAHRVRAGQLGSDANVAVAYPTKPDGAEKEPVTSWSFHGGDHAEVAAIKKTGIAKARGRRVGDWVGRVYTELEPCPRCKVDLGALLEDDAVVEYTAWFESQWSNAQNSLKSRAMSIAEIDFLLEHATTVGLSTPDLQAESLRLKSTALDKKGTPYSRESATAARQAFAAGAAALYQQLLTAEINQHPELPASQARTLLAHARDTRHFDKYRATLTKIREQASRARLTAPMPPTHAPLTIPNPRPSTTPAAKPWLPPFSLDSGPTAASPHPSASFLAAPQTPAPRPFLRNNTTTTSPPTPTVVSYPWSNTTAPPPPTPAARPFLRNSTTVSPVDPGTMPFPTTSTPSPHISTALPFLRNNTTGSTAGPALIPFPRIATASSTPFPGASTATPLVPAPAPSLKRKPSAPLIGQPPLKQARSDAITANQADFLRILARKRGPDRFNAVFDQVSAGIAPRQPDDTTNSLIARLTKSAASTMIDRLKAG